jgi:hypothetical protein
MTFNEPLCLLCIFKTNVLFGVLLTKKHVFINRNFQMKYFELFIYCIYSYPSMSHVFVQSILNKYENLKVYKYCEILCFILKICHNFKSYQNMLTFSSLISYIINYNFYLNNTLHHIYMLKRIHELKTI